MQVRRHGRVAFAFIAAVTALAVAGCTSSSSAPSTSSSGKKTGGTKVAGGVVTFANPSSGPNYIFPFDSADFFTQTNLSYLQQMLYRPLYWYGDGSSPKINYGLSLGKPPVYSNGNKTVTITLNKYKWSDGTPVTARDVLFWQNLMKANKANWGAYTPGDYPDNIASTKIVNASTIQFNLTKAYDTNWFTYNELSQITPLPQQAWDKTSATSADGNYDMTPAGAKQVYTFLAGEAKKLSTYASNPIWKTVDGPWTLTAYTASNGNLTLIPNPKYSGPTKPTISKFEEVAFTAVESEFKALLGGSGPDVGYISNVEVKSQPALNRIGYTQSQVPSFSISYRSLNFNNPTVGVLFKQDYIRQVMQLLTNQNGIIKSYYNGYGYPDCGPVPTQPKNAFADAYASSCPYAYSPSKASALLSAHGWKVVPGGTDTCIRPGTAANECGAGIAAGMPLKFTLSYATGGISYPKQIAQQKSDASKVGLDYVLDGETYNNLSAETVPCKPTEKTCKWQMSDAAWIYAPDFYPTGESLFQTGAGYNTGSYSDPTLDKLIEATTLPGDSQQTLNAYQDYMTKKVPVIWQPNTSVINEVKTKLQGVTPYNIFGNLTPEDWYFTK